MDVSEHKCHNGNKVHLWEYNGSRAQQFYHGPNGQIMSALCHKALDIAFASCDNFTNIMIQDRHDGWNQKFEFRYGGIWNKHCNKSIDNAGGGSGNGNNIVLYESNKSPMQQWHLQYHLN